MSNVCIAVPSAKLQVSCGTALPTVKAPVLTLFKEALRPLVQSFMSTEIQSLFTYTGRTKDLVRGISLSIARGLSPLFVCLRAILGIDLTT